MKRGMTSFFIYGWGGNSRSHVKLMDPSWQLWGLEEHGTGAWGALGSHPPPRAGVWSGGTGPAAELCCPYLFFTALGIISKPPGLLLSYTCRHPFLLAVPVCN